MPSIPTAQLMCCPLPQVGRRISASPLNSLLLSWGQTQHSRARQGGGSSGKQLKTLVLEPSGHLGTPLCLLQEPLLNGVQRSCLWPTFWGGGALIPHYMHFSFS